MCFNDDRGIRVTCFQMGNHGYDVTCFCLLYFRGFGKQGYQCQGEKDTSHVINKLNTYCIPACRIHRMRVCDCERTYFYVYMRFACERVSFIVYYIFSIFFLPSPTFFGVGNNVSVTDIKPRKNINTIRYSI